MYELKATAGFDAALTEENTAPGIVTLKLTAKSETAKKLEIRVKWYTEDIGVNAVWSPLSYRNKTVRPDWGGYYDSNAMRSQAAYSPRRAPRKAASRQQAQSCAPICPTRRTA